MTTQTVRHLDHLNLSVRSLRETAEWYDRVFGFQVVEEGIRDGRPWGVLRAGDAFLCVYEHPELDYVEPDEQRRRGQHALSHFALRITDGAAFEATVERERLATYWGSPVRYPHSTSWYVRDPTGYEIEVALWDGDQARFG